MSNTVLKVGCRGKKMYEYIVGLECNTTFTFCIIYTT